jgi:phosphonate transport system substrate-binding protein
MNITRHTLLRGAAAAALALLTACDKKPEASGGGGSSGSGTKVLRFSAIPNQNATELKAKYDPMAAYLSKELGVTVEFFPSADYKASVEAFKNSQVQLAWFGGVTSVQAWAAVPGAKAIVHGKEDTDFKSYFIAHKDTGLEKSDTFPAGIGALKFAFGSETSTSGRVMPSYFIKQNTGKGEKEFFTQPVIFTGAHDKTIEAVATGAAQAGVCDFTVYDKLVKEGKVDPAVAKVIWVTPGYMDYTFTAHPSLEQDFGAGFTEKLKAALLAMNTKAPELLKAFPRESLIEARNEDYKMLEGLCRELGIVR